MAFENLSNKLQEVFKQLRSKGVLTEADVKAAMREVKIALLEADVNFKIVKEFIKKVTERAVGTEVLQGLNPGQQVIKIVNEELIALMGSTQAQLTFSRKPPTVFMMVGLQGAGKTTTSGKLAGQLRKQGRSPLLVACDVYRPAAIKQLQVVGKNYNIPVFEMGTEVSPVEISKKALEYAAQQHHDVILIDTAGRLHINEELMQELQDIKTAVRPQEILLVVDAMTGQDAVTVAESFDGQLGVDGIILTKLDGDARGGAALSVRSVTNKPIKYIGMGEKMEDLEPFYPDRMASRILGMGDVLSLIDKTYQAMIEKQNGRLEQYALLITILLVLLLVALVYIYRQVKKLSVARNHLQTANEQLNSLNEELSAMNTCLQSTNLELSESNQIKEEYIARFVKLCSTYIDKLDAYRRMVNKKISAGQTADLLKITRSQDALDSELEELYVNFDTTFLHIFPDFVRKFNALLQDDGQVILKRGELLNTELRIFALIRLGIEDSSQIAEFLRYSVNTIYNYRSKVKNKACISRDDFEERVKEIR